MNVQLVMPIDLEERREDLVHLPGSQRLGANERQVECPIGRAVAAVVIQLLQQHWCEMKRDVDIVLSARAGIE